jgi:hypothetical protein
MNSDYRLRKRMMKEKPKIAKSISDVQSSHSENVQQSCKDNGTLKSFVIEIPGNDCFVSSM